MEGQYPHLEEFLKESGPNIKLSVCFQAGKFGKCIIVIRRAAHVKRKDGMQLERVAADSLDRALSTLNYQLDKKHYSLG